MKKIYENPTIEVELVELNEVLLASSILGGDGLGGFGEEEYPEW